MFCLRARSLLCTERGCGRCGARKLRPRHQALGPGTGAALVPRCCPAPAALQPPTLESLSQGPQLWWCWAGLRAGKEKLSQINRLINSHICTPQLSSSQHDADPSGHLPQGHQPGQAAAPARGGAGGRLNQGSVFVVLSTARSPAGPGGWHGLRASGHRVLTASPTTASPPAHPALPRLSPACRVAPGSPAAGTELLSSPGE